MRDMNFLFFGAAFLLFVFTFALGLSKALSGFIYSPVWLPWFGEGNGVFSPQPSNGFFFFTYFFFFFFLLPKDTHPHSCYRYFGALA